MARRFRSRSLATRPVHRIKHVVDNQAGVTIGGTGTNVQLIQSVDAPLLASPQQVETGSTVHGIYLKAEAYATSAAALANIYMIVWKNPGGNLTAPQPNLVGTNDNKKYVIHQEMVMMQRVDKGNPRTIFNGVIVIPRGYKRMGINDTLNALFFSPGVTADLCVQCHYKEFR